MVRKNGSTTIDGRQQNMKTTRTKTIHKRINTGHLIVHLALLAGIVVVVFPFLWMLLTSFKTTGESLKIPPTFFPEKWTLEAYKTITSSTIPFGTVYLNTILSAVITTVVQIVFCSMAGYAFRELSSRSKTLFSYCCYPS